MFNRKMLFTLARYACAVRGHFITNLLFCMLMFFGTYRAYAQAKDTITFNDGEQLAGKLVRVLGGTVTSTARSSEM